jgi:hypothetical protein
MNYATRAAVVGALIGSLGGAAFATGAEARHGRNAALAAGAAVGVLAGAAIASSARPYYYDPGYTDGCYDEYCDGPVYGGPPPRVYYAPPTYRYGAPPAYGYDAPQPVYRGAPYYYPDGSEIAIERFENRE